MISLIEYRQLQAYARQDGFLMGMIWVVTFACLVGSMSHPLLEMGFMMGIVATPFVVFSCLRRFRNKVLGGTITYGRALLFTATTLGCASVIIAAATMAYFYFLDNGMLLSQMKDMVAIPEVRQTYLSAGVDPKILDEELTIMSQLRPVDFAFNMLFDSLVTSFFLAMVVSVFGAKRKMRN